MYLVKVTICLVKVTICIVVFWTIKWLVYLVKMTMHFFECAKADLRLRWVHWCVISNCWFCRAVAHLCSTKSVPPSHLMSDSAVWLVGHCSLQLSWAWPAGDLITGLSTYMYFPSMLGSIKTEMSRIMTKPTKWLVRSAKTQISLGIRPVWSVSLLCA